MGRPGTEGNIIEIGVIIFVQKNVFLQVRKTWGRELCRQNWGSNVRARVFARKRLGREPKAKELEDLYEEGSRAYSVTPEEIVEAYTTGKEV